MRYYQSKEIEELKGVVSKKFSLKEGPYILGLESALQEMDVHRQAYQGGTFVGNHVHKLLKVESTSVQCMTYFVV